MIVVHTKKYINWTDRHDTTHIHDLLWIKLGFGEFVNFPSVPLNIAVLLSLKIPAQLYSLVWCGHSGRPQNEYVWRLFILSCQVTNVNVYRI